jgi:hypothetical protein
MKANATSNRLTAKTSLAQQVAEDLLSKKIDDAIYTSSTPAAAYDFNLSTAAVDDAVIAGAGTYHATYATLINTPGTNITTITITITTVPTDGNPLTLTCYKRTI